MLKKWIILLPMVFLFLFPLSARYLRVNQVGYLEGDFKVANLFSNENLNALQWEIVTVPGGAVAAGPYSVGVNLGSYSGYSFHYKLDFSNFAQPGAYKIRLSGGSAESYPFEIGRAVYNGAADMVVGFLRAQRCGYNPLLETSCHKASGTGRMDGRTVGGPRSGAQLDASGGWHDAGDYIKFMIGNANVTLFLLLAYQENPAAFGDRFQTDGDPGANGLADVLDEAKYGLDWIMKMHPSADEFYYQVGDQTDHNTWKLPQNDNSAYSTSPYRPVYHCNSGQGANVAGKAAAALALASVIWKGLGDSAYGELCLTHAKQLYAFGKSNPAAQPSTPADFYGETDWRDDMELAAAELFKATGSQVYLSDAEAWAPSVGSMWGHTNWGSINVFAHFELYSQTNNTVLKDQLKQFIQYDLDGHKGFADQDMFGIGADYYWGSQAINTAGILAAYLYRKNFTDTSYNRMAAGMRDNLLGRNQWSVSFIVGLGSDYADHPHHQITEIRNISIPGMCIEGAVSQGNWSTYGAQKPSPAQDPYNAFQSSVAVYYDYMEDYSTNEPTVWQAALSVAALAFLAQDTDVASPGDVNGDCIVNIVDALMVAQYSVGLTPPGFTSSNADVNCDGSISIIDALIIAQYNVGLITEFCLTL